VTLAPTAAPTPPPTNAGFEVVEREVETKAVVAAITFGAALTVAEARHPVMQQSMRSGFAAAVGLGVDHVDILEVTESKSTTTTRRERGRRERRLQGGGAGGADVKFKITSADPSGSAVTQLERDVKERTAEGAVVAGIIKKAAENKVLTPGLAGMDIKVIVTTSVVATKTTVTELVESSSSSSSSSSSGLGAGAIAGIAVGAVALVAAIAFAATQCKSKSDTPSQPEQEAITPVGYGNTEGALTTGQAQKY
jgi:hypothetical protein